ncbi:GIY-YIG nuclease family protein [Paenisporosarcina quisquiliarum]|jgi:putative endonuclease|uniref:GIY-YIG nuclease family protein n=1 Tax=Paenisporosarcina quisquiliarum TaxID=365346 RepID=A0A9X3RF26_9BACL|nr:GIY-YIG nuclease family protein [Paenisporosarcina quisquiliarum]MCZ8538484.1 GIY-YIG nuclease family protein [Paenisporosarcina quisquiliarum]
MERTNEHIFYVLECSDGSYYAGYTNDLTKRLNVHNNGKGAKYTRARRPVTCIYQEAFETKQLAMKAEYAFKQLKKSEKIVYMANGMRGEQ